MSCKVTDWINGNKPEHDGWYIVKHPKDNWVSEVGVAKFEAGKWMRPLGWPTPNGWPANVHAYCEACTVRTGVVFENDAKVFNEVYPTAFRGLACKP